MPSSREVIAFSCLSSHYLDFPKIKAHSLSAYVSLAEVNYVTHKTAVKHKILFVHFYHGGCSGKNYFSICFINSYFTNSTVACCFCSLIFLRGRKVAASFLEIVAA